MLGAMGLVLRVAPLARPAGAATRREARGRAAAAVGVHALLGLVGAAAALAAGHEVAAREPWLDAAAAGDGWEGGTAELARLAASLGAGAVAAGALVVTSRWLVFRAAWARKLADDLGEPVRDAPGAGLLAVAVASGLGEELFFRGFLAQSAGLVLSCLAFGALHRAGGPARLAYVAWASLAGLVFGLVFFLTGRLAGAAFAHVAVNAANLVWLRARGRAAHARGAP